MAGKSKGPHSRAAPRRTAYFVFVPPTALIPAPVSLNTSPAPPPPPAALPKIRINSHPRHLLSPLCCVCVMIQPMLY